MIKYGVIGNNLEHSLAPEVHNMFFNIYSLDGDFEKVNVSLNDFNNIDIHDLLIGFKGANVSSPYKVRVISLLDQVSDEVRAIGSVNTINNINGKLIGYNTDAEGFKELLSRNGIKPRNKVFVIMGSGGTARSVVYYLKDKAKDIYVVARNTDKDTIEGAKVIDYDQLPFLRGDVLINTTPVGMYPNVDKCIVDKSIVENYEYIIDLVYNPIFTKLMQIGVKMGKKCIPGLYMLVSQGITSQGYWQGIKMDSMISRVYKEISIIEQKKAHGNVYITGMMGCGKTELGKSLSKALNREFIDLDEYIEKISKKKLSELLADGQEVFREWETKAIQKIAFMKDKIVALGGGAVLNEYNVLTMKLSGILILRDRSLDRILSSIDLDAHPSIKGKEDLIQMYNERYPIYLRICDWAVPYGELDLDTKKIVEVLK
ncbi:MAG: hypothetical protein K5923_07015 [Clostridia bacterium]|nr:hypothetical protein [Clostridia bacterium]